MDRLCIRTDRSSLKGVSAIIVVPDHSYQPMDWRDQVSASVVPFRPLSGRESGRFFRMALVWSVVEIVRLSNHILVVVVV